ncbi:MAG: hypothetical protein Q4F81_04435 [Eubacteriales bacterium]|nr:hypothetical protein [Eubacteriales bacterium]
MAEIDVIFQQFRSASREQVRLPLAVRIFFSGEAAPEQARELESYLKRRVRSVMELLLQEDELPKLEQLAGAGWLTPGLVEDGLDMAVCLKKTEGFVWLMKWKAENYGFADRDFTL